MLQLLKDYDFTLQYHTGKENVVADALSHKTHGFVASLMIREWRALEIMLNFNFWTTEIEEGQHFGCLIVQPIIIECILEA